MLNLNWDSRFHVLSKVCSDRDDTAPLSQIIVLVYWPSMKFANCEIIKESVHLWLLPNYKITELQSKNLLYVREDTKHPAVVLSENV